MTASSLVKSAHFSAYSSLPPADNRHPEVSERGGSARTTRVDQGRYALYIIISEASEASSRL
jgi:hypothetical protein